MSRIVAPVATNALKKNGSAGVIELSKLPLFHPAALELLRISTESDDAPKQYEEIFRSDVGLATELLLVVNSAAFGGRAHIESIRHAILFLGLERVKALANTIAFCFYVRTAPRMDYVRSVWRHAIATAILAEKIGKVHDRANGYTAGLMHDVGRLVLLKSAGATYGDELSVCFGSVEAANELEVGLYGMSHCTAGGAVARQWGFPANLCRCMEGHHSSPNSPIKDELDDVRLACRTAGLLGYPEVPTAVPYPPLTSELASLPQFAESALIEEIESRIGMLER